jgi:hypothetical protein
MDAQILCQCWVEDLGNMMYAVEVTGVAPFDHERTYTIKAKDDNSAAKEGMELFIKEMECLSDSILKED